jgi:subtilisin family serine protease
MTFRLGALGVTTALALAASGGIAAAAAPGAGTPGFAPSTVLVGYTSDAPAAARASARARVRATGVAPLSRLSSRAERLSLPAGMRVPDAIAALERDPSVRYAEPDWKLMPTATSNDPGVTGGSTWGLYGPGTSPSNAFGSQAMAAWSAEHTGSRGVVVGVVDTGIDINHRDLAANIFTNPGEIPGNGIDDDKNGFIDDTNGWDFHHNDRTVYDSSNSDAHGTHVAGTIGAVGGNGTGVAGVAWQVTMVPAKFLGPNGGYISNAVKALDYLTDLKTRHNLNLVASNNSWGGGGASSALRDAINRGGNAGILFVAAAGNDGRSNDATASYPSNYACTTTTRTWDCVVSVASITSTGALSGFSNFGATTVDLGAPGSSIYSTLPANKYGTYSGTSMAAPHVTGALALCRAAYPALAPDATRTSLFATITATDSLSGQTVTGGRLNAAALASRCAAQAPSPDPNIPPDPEPEVAPGAFVKSAPSNGRTGLSPNVKLTWTASANLTGYEVCVDRTNDNRCDVDWKPFPATVTSVNMRLAGKTTYYWQARAVNATGTTEANAGTWWSFTTK